MSISKGPDISQLFRILESAVLSSFTDMAESVPLRPTLRIQIIYVIVRNSLCKNFDLMLENFTGERRLGRDIQRKVRWNNVPSLDFLRSLLNSSRCQEVYSAKLQVVSVHAQ